MPKVTYSYRFSYGQPRSTEPHALPSQRPSLLGRVLGVVITIAVLGVLTLISVIVLPILLVAVMIGAIYLGFKVWSIKKQVEQVFAEAAPENAKSTTEADYIDVDYTERK